MLNKNNSSNLLSLLYKLEATFQDIHIKLNALIFYVNLILYIIFLNMKTKAKVPVYLQKLIKQRLGVHLQLAFS